MKASTEVHPSQAARLNVREAMDRIGLQILPDVWTGKEYQDHWRLGLSKWPPTKLRGMQAVRELLHRVWVGGVIVEIVEPDGSYRPAEFEVRHFHGSESWCAGVDEAYLPCVLTFLPATTASNAGRKGFTWPEIAVRILEYLDEHGTVQTADQVAQSVRVLLQREGKKAPSYQRIQPFARSLLSYRIAEAQAVTEINSGTGPCSEI